MRFCGVARLSGAPPTALAMALSTPLHAAKPVPVARPGICGSCGLATSYACPQCVVAHFCSTGCLERARDMHTPDCGKPSCKAVDLPSDGRLLGCWINAYLRGGGRFSLHQPDNHPPMALQPSPSYGLVSLQLDPKIAGELAQLVTSNRDAHGYLKICDNSYPGYKGYTAIPGEVNNEEQCRVTSQLARKGRGGNDHDRLRGLQYAIDHCSALRLLVDEVCLYLGGC